jgi:hypothetical protein
MYLPVQLLYANKIYKNYRLEDRQALTLFKGVYLGVLPF